MNLLSLPTSASSFGSSPSLEFAAGDIDPFAENRRWISKIYSSQS
jgi:hypothetical protein